MSRAKTLYSKPSLIQSNWDRGEVIQIKLYSELVKQKVATKDKKPET
jgi:hypothetical protein